MEYITKCSANYSTMTYSSACIRQYSKTFTDKAAFADKINIPTGQTSQREVYI